MLDDISLGLILLYLNHPWALAAVVVLALLLSVLLGYVTGRYTDKGNRHDHHDQ